MANSTARIETETELETSWRSALSREEINALLELRDLRTWGSIALNWSLVAGSMAAVAAWPNVVTIVFALFVIGTRQLGFALLMHDAAHRTLLRNRNWNDWIGNWGCAYPIWSDLTPYRPYHLQHHAKTGRDDDPDIALVMPFPITRSSFRRKAWRDLSGQTGRKFAKAAWNRTFGCYREDPVARRAAQGVLATNALLLGALTAIGRPELYLLWAGAWLTTHTFVTRLRSIAEHAMTPDRSHPLRNTRTTVARWWERLLVAPNRVNYHLEHHLLMTVPHYNLPKLHALLRDRGALDHACVARGYWTTLKRAVSRPETQKKEGGDRTGSDDEGARLYQVNGL